MTRSTIPRADLSEKTQEMVDRLHHGGDARSPKALKGRGQPPSSCSSETAEAFLPMIWTGSPDSAVSSIRRKRFARALLAVVVFMEPRRSPLGPSGLS